MKQVGVLDKGHVDYVDHMGTDLTVCNAARVSFNNESEWGLDFDAIERLKSCPYNKDDVRMLKDKDVKLIKYLAKHNHWTPFAHPQITLRIKAPISIRTQFFKHKQGFTENEISRRYVSFEPDFYLPMWRTKPTDGAKQGSEDFITEETRTNLYDAIYKESYETALHVYNTLIEKGVAPEQARFVLPQGMYTEWYWTGSLAAYARFYKQRKDDHAQWEIREYAKAVGKIIEPYFPVSWKQLTN
jgi:thymidylate synthase (FAD)